MTIAVKECPSCSARTLRPSALDDPRDEQEWAGVLADADPQLVRTYSPSDGAEWRCSACSATFALYPAVKASTIRRVPDEEALAFIDEKLGHADEWPSPLVQYRLQEEFQADWKAELGQWLKAAEEFGFLDKVVHIVRAERRRRSRESEVVPHDQHHLKLHQRVADAEIVHYLDRLDWSFEAFEPETGGSVDIDVSLTAPTGQLVELQVKSPDRPGRLRNFKYVDGDSDENLLIAVKKARKQLRSPATSPAMIGICANRNIRLAPHPRALVTHLFGSTIQAGERVYLPWKNRGVFFKHEWEHVSGVFAVDLLRGDCALYSCTVLLNPNAAHPASPDWLPRARVVVLEGDTFRWIRGEPGRATTLPTGTMLVTEEPISIAEGGDSAET